MEERAARTEGLDGREFCRELRPGADRLLEVVGWLVA